MFDNFLTTRSARYKTGLDIDNGLMSYWGVPMSSYPVDPGIKVST